MPCFVDMSLRLAPVRISSAYETPIQLPYRPVSRKFFSCLDGQTDKAFAALQSILTAGLLASSSCKVCRYRITLVAASKSITRHATSLQRRMILPKSFLFFLSTAAPLPRSAEAADGWSLVQQGMSAFQRGEVDDSIRLFDEAASTGYAQARLWQRGLSLYYAGRFQDGATQFRQDVQLNPYDTEESIWAMLCEAQLFGFDEARKRMLVIERDPRQVMHSVYSLFRGSDESAYEKLERLAAGSGSDQFYSALYLGLFEEARGDAKQARYWLEKSVASDYAESRDYMAGLAKVHVQLRGWGSSARSKTEL